MFNEMTGEGNFRAFTDMLEGEQLAPEYKLTATITQLNSCLFSLASCFMKATQPRMGKLVEASRKLSTYEYQCMIGRAKELRQEWVDYWRSNRLDLVICPGFATEAPNHGASNNASVMAAYTFIWNLLGVPVATTPVTTTRTDEQRYESAYDDDITRAIRRWAADSAGLPVGVQIVGLPFAD
jgi:Asp-tRNA(Asn)/Glu-tRNA(Gln) amidotransferase A subunit family amidase